MIGDRNFKAEGGDHSSFNQAEHIEIHNQGLSTSDVITIWNELSKGLLAQVSQIALDTYVKRTDDLASKLVKAIESTVGSFDSFVEPGMQMAFYAAQQTYAKSGEQPLLDVLVDFLTQRAKTPKRNVEQLFIDECLSVLARISTDQLNILSFIYIHNQQKKPLINLSTDLSISYHELILEITSIIKLFKPFIYSLTTDNLTYNQLAHHGCINFKAESEEFFIYKVISLYPGLFCKGTTEEKFQELFGSDYGKLPTRTLIPCLHNPQLLQPNYQTLDERTKLCGLLANLFTRHWGLILETIKSTEMIPNEAVSCIVQDISMLDTILKAWNSSQIKNCVLTDIGKKIAEVNIKYLSAL